MLARARGTINSLAGCSCNPLNVHVKVGKGTPSMSKQDNSKVWPTSIKRGLLAGSICNAGATVKGGEGGGEGGEEQRGEGGEEQGGKGGEEQFKEEREGKRGRGRARRRGRGRARRRKGLKGNEGKGFPT